MKIILLIITFASQYMLVGCDDSNHVVPSNDPDKNTFVETAGALATNNIKFNSTIILTESSLTVKVLLNEENSGDDILLTGGDHLLLNTGSEDVEFVKKEGSNYWLCLLYSYNCTEVFYQVTIPAVEVTSSTVQIKLIRPDAADALNNYITLPSVATLIAPLESETYSRSKNNIDVLWSNPQSGNNVVSIRASGAYDGVNNYYYYDDLINDDGSYTIPAGTLTTRDFILLPDTNSSIPYDKLGIEVVRVNYANGDDVFSSANISAKSIAVVGIGLTE